MPEYNLKFSEAVEIMERGGWCAREPGDSTYRFSKGVIEKQFKNGCVYYWSSATFLEQSPHAKWRIVKEPEPDFYEDALREHAIASAALEELDKETVDFALKELNEARERLGYPVGKATEIDPSDFRHEFCGTCLHWISWEPENVSPNGLCALTGARTQNNYRCDRWELWLTEYVLPKGFKWPDRTLAEDLANLEKEEWPEIHLGGLDVAIPSELDIRKLEERIRRLEEWLT